MASDDDSDVDLPTEEGRVVVQLSRALFSNDVDQVFRILGEYIDKHNLKISAEVMAEYKFAERFEET